MSAARRVKLAAGATLLAVTGVSQAALRHEVLDDFRSATAWQASASDQVHAALRVDATDGSLCLDYDFGGVSGYAVMRRELPVEWPQHFELKLRFKGAGAVNDLQMKLVDASGDNVWWMNRPAFPLPERLTEMKLRRRHVDFAWGPTADRTLRQTRFVEFVVAAGQNEGSGGRGTLCVARLELNERAPDPTPWPEPRRSVRGGTLDLDFLHAREFNGVALRWPAAAPRALDYSLLTSDDGRRWKRLRAIKNSGGGLDTIWLPESEARHLRVQMRVPKRVQNRGAKPTTLPALELRDAAQWPDFNAVLAEQARNARAGDLPRAFLGQQNYWALVGVDGGGERSALLSEDGAIEIGRGGVSIEPAVQIDGAAPLTWADVQATQSLRDGYLPLPAVHWRHEAFTLDIEAAADGVPQSPQALARYTLVNRADRARRFTLLLALRPWQVNPPQQFLTTPGGASPVRELAWADGVLAVNGRQRLRPTEPPRAVSAAPLDAGVSLDVLRKAAALTTLQDPQAHASALLQFDITLQAGERRTIGWAAPLNRQATRPDAIDNATLDARFDNVAMLWRERLNRVTLTLPTDAQPIADTLRSTLAQMLVSRDGAALKPGTRAYARTWVRDGAMMVAALLPLGEVDAAREFVDWFAGFIFDSGKVPCCVDSRGADPVAENDSHGQYLYAVAEVWRHTRDRAWLARHWPTVQRVLAYQEQLRQSERGARNMEPGRGPGGEPSRAHLFGLMPPSISHEGYSDKAAYSYWDDFWALRGYKDALLTARVLGHENEAQRWSQWLQSFERELGASINATAAHHRIDFIPGAADRGDFDPTSTTIALNPVQAELPPALLGATFERYWRESLARAEGKREWKDYTPYELRSVGALARLGHGMRAHAMLDFFMRDRRPAAWNQWAEVVRPGYRERGFFGDLPHAWVASDYIRSALDLFAYEREADASIVVGAGWKTEWLAQGLEVRGLSTAFGVLDYKLERASDGWRFTLARGLPDARGGVQLQWPGDGPLPLAQIDGRVLSWSGRSLTLPAAAGTLTLIRR